MEYNIEKYAKIHFENLFYIMTIFYLNETILALISWFIHVRLRGVKMKKKTLYIVSASMLILSIIVLAIAAIITTHYPKHWWTILVSTILFVTFFILTCVIYFPNAEFICAKCNKQFKPTVSASILGMHTITRRYLRCPHCNQKSWAKETWNIEKEKHD